MSLDGAFLHIVTNELQPLIGARVDKVYQPSREEIVVSLRTFRDGGKKIVLSANSVSARALTSGRRTDWAQATTRASE